MKRIWFGAALLVLLLVLGIGSGALMERLQAEQVQRLEQAARLAADGDWAAARTLTTQAKEEWARRQLLIAALCDHDLMDHIEELFAQMEVFSESRSTASFRNACVCLARRLDALGSSHSFTPENIL